MSPARTAILKLLQTAEARNYSTTYKEALRTALVVVECAEIEAARPEPYGPPVIYERRSSTVELPVVRWDEVVSQ